MTTPYLLMPLGACIASAVLATAVIARDPMSRAGRLAAALIGGCSVWALCEVLWNTRPDAASAAFFLRLSAVGWVFIGPLALHTVREVSGQELPRVDRLLPFLHMVSAGFLLAAWFTPWLHSGLVRTSWGWAYEIGWLHPIYLAFTSWCIAAALACGSRAYRVASPGERAQSLVVGGGIVTAFVLASITDGLLPLFGHQVPRLGTTAMTLFGATVAWGLYRYGYSLLAPGSFAGEILETLPNGVAMLRMDGRIRSANETMARMLGTTHEALIGVPMRSLVIENDLDPTGVLLEREGHLRDVDGKRVAVSLSSKILCDRQGEPIGVVLVARDVREVVALRGRLVMSDRLAAVGELAAGIAHEINNPLAYVRSNLMLLRRHWDDLRDQLEKAESPGHAAALIAEGEEVIEESIEGIDRAAAIIRDVRGLSRGAQREPELADVNGLLDGVIRMASSQLGRSVWIHKDYASLPAIRCAPQELQQVFLNLVMNAGHAIDGEGDIRVITRCDGDHVVIRVEDDGRGIEPDVIPRIFDPFFTTKAVGEGTGLGLGIALEIVRGHGGDIGVESSPGAGAAFSVRLPTHADRMGPHHPG